MTEDNAKTKWCPQDMGSDRYKCIGSECMAWRWLVKPLEDDEPVIEATYHYDSGTVKSSNAVSSGFCGLAGKP